MDQYGRVPVITPEEAANARAYVDMAIGDISPRFNRKRVDAERKATYNYFDTVYNGERLRLVPSAIERLYGKPVSVIYEKGIEFGTKKWRDRRIGITETGYMRVTKITEKSLCYEHGITGEKRHIDLHAIIAIKVIYYDAVRPVGDDLSEDEIAYLHNDVIEVKDND